MNSPIRACAAVSGSAQFRGVVGAKGTRDWGFARLKDHFSELSSGGGIFFTSRLPALVGGVLGGQVGRD